MANIREVAEKAGVSIASVSRIINNDATYKTTPQTRNRVLSAAAELNYEAKPVEGKRRKPAPEIRIGCLNKLTAEKTKDSYFASIFNGIQSLLRRQNCKTELIQSQFDLLDGNYLEDLLKQHLSGLILMDTPSPEILEIIRKKVNYIVGVDTALYDIDNVRYNRYEAGCKAVSYLIENGHKKIAYIGSHISSALFDMGRFDAYLKVMRHNGLAVNDEWMIDCEWQRQICFDKTTELLKMKNRPTAFFVASDHMAIACMSAIHQLQIKIPDEISIVGISDIDASKFLNPPLTTIAIPQHEIGEIAASTLLQRINGDNTVSKQIYVPTKLIVRTSVKNING